MKPVTEVFAGIVVGLTLGGLFVWGVVKLGDYIVRIYP